MSLADEDGMLADVARMTAAPAAAAGGLESMLTPIQRYANFFSLSVTYSRVSLSFSFFSFSRFIYINTLLMRVGLCRYALRRVQDVRPTLHSTSERTFADTPEAAASAAMSASAQSANEDDADDEEGVDDEGDAEVDAELDIAGARKKRKRAAAAEEVDEEILFYEVNYIFIFIFKHPCTLPHCHTDTCKEKINTNIILLYFLFLYIPTFFLPFFFFPKKEAIMREMREAVRGRAAAAAHAVVFFPPPFFRGPCQEKTKTKQKRTAPHTQPRAMCVFSLVVLFFACYSRMRVSGRRARGQYLIFPLCVDFPLELI